MFFLTGFWHGANWTFIVWGLFHGVFLILEDAINIGLKKRNVSKENSIKNNNFAVRVLKNIYVWVVVTVGFVFFRADNIGIAFSFIGKMFAGFSKSRASIVLVSRLFNPYNLCVLVLAFILSYPVLKLCKGKLEDKKIYQSVFAVGSLLLLGLCVLNLASEAYNPFIYFRF